MHVEKRKRIEHFSKGGAAKQRKSKCTPLKLSQTKGEVNC